MVLPEAEQHIFNLTMKKMKRVVIKLNGDGHLIDNASRYDESDTSKHSLLPPINSVDFYHITGTGLNKPILVVSIFTCNVYL